MRKGSAIPAGFELQPIDDAARDGRFQLVFGGAFFALVRWHAGRWVHSSSLPLDFEPTQYRANAHG